MSTLISDNVFQPGRETRMLLLKWLVALIVPVAVFTFVWSGEEIVNNVMLGVLSPGSTPYDVSTLIQAAIFIAIFYAAIIALAGYFVAADSGRRSMGEIWLDIAVFTLVPIFLVMETGLIIGLALCVLVWGAFFYVRTLVRRMRHYTAPPPLANLKVITTEQRANLMNKAIAGGFWFGVAFSLLSLVVDLIFFFSGSLPTTPQA